MLKVNNYERFFNYYIGNFFNDGENLCCKVSYDKFRDLDKFNNLDKVKIFWKQYNDQFLGNVVDYVENNSIEKLLNELNTNEFYLRLNRGVKEFIVNDNECKLGFIHSYMILYKISCYLHCDYKDENIISIIKNNVEKLFTSANLLMTMFSSSSESLNSLNQEFINQGASNSDDNISDNNNQNSISLDFSALLRQENISDGVDNNSDNSAGLKLNRIVKSSDQNNNPKYFCKEEGSTGDNTLNTIHNEINSTDDNNNKGCFCKIQGETNSYECKFSCEIF